MSVKSDRWIRKMALEHGMIEPFEENQIRDGVISYGLSSYGYDFRISDEFEVLSSAGQSIRDPKKLSDGDFISVRASEMVIPAHGYVLAKTVEYFRIPRQIITICFGKSTYARCGLLINVTPFEPEWEGFATIAIQNTSFKPVRIYAKEGIGQLLFLESDEVCARSYADKKGKYQGQQEITHAKIEKGQERA